MADLVVRTEGEERLFRLEEDSVVVGRMPGCAIQIDDLHSSRRHCQVIRVRGGFELVDLKSRNGTLLNGQKVERKLLRHGDVIRIGEVEILFRDPEGAPPAEPEDGIVLEDVAAAAPTPARSPARTADTACQLRHVGGDRDGATLSLAADRTTIGRREGNTIVIKDAMISSYHCEITREGGGYVLRDLGSTNGSHVDGEPVTEVALHHGSRIRLGASRFLFIDPGMAAFDAALDQSDDAGDWGMMREIDATAVPRRGMRLGAPIGLLLIVAVIVAGYFFMSGKERSRAAGLGAPVGNELPYYSFEDEALPFEAPEGAAVAAVSGGHSGRQAIRLSRGERTGTVEVAFPGISVDPTKRARLEGWVSPGDGAATLRIAWTLRGGFRTPWDSTAPPVTGRGGFRKVSLLVSPPDDAVDLVVRLVLLEGEAATFDDVTVQWETGRSAPIRVRTGDFEILADDGGSVGVLRDGDWVLMNGGVVARLEDGRVLDARHGLARLDGVREENGGIVWSGALTDLAGGDPVPFEARVTPGKEEAAISVQAAGVRAGLAFTTDRSLLEEPVYLLGPAVRTARFGAFERTEGLERITFGVGWNRLGAAAPEKSAGLAAALETRGGEVRLALDATVAAEGGAVVRLLTSFDVAARQAADLWSRANRLARQGGSGEAWSLCQEIVGGYSFREEEARKAAELMKSIEDGARAREEAVRHDFETGRDFLSDEALARAEAGAEEIALRWTGTDRGDAAKGLLDEIRARRLEMRRDAQQELAAGELRRAKDLAAADLRHLAIAVYRSVADRFPDVEAAEEARQALRELGVGGGGAGSGGGR